MKPLKEVIWNFLEKKFRPKTVPPRKSKRGASYPPLTTTDYEALLKACDDNPAAMAILYKVLPPVHRIRKQTFGSVENDEFAFDEETNEVTKAGVVQTRAHGLVIAGDGQVSSSGELRAQCIECKQYFLEYYRCETCNRAVCGSHRGFLNTHEGRRLLCPECFKRESFWLDEWALDRARKESKKKESHD